MPEIDQRPAEPPGSGPAPKLTTEALLPVAQPQRTFATITLAKRVPFTASFVVAMVLAISLGTLWSGIEAKSWYDYVAYGLPSFDKGRWYTLVTGNFFALVPAYYLFVVGLFALLTGFAEWRLGTKRTIVITVGYQFAAVLLTALFLLIFRHTGWEWFSQRATETDVGFSAGMLAVFSVATATVRPPWRLRLRLLLWVYVIFSIMYIGQMADAEHFFAVVLSMPFSSKLAGPRALKARALPTRHEVRSLAFILVLFAAASQLISVFLPDRLTLFGPAANDNTNTWYALLINLVITLLIANGLSTKGDAHLGRLARFNPSGPPLFCPKCRQLRD